MSDPNLFNREPLANPGLRYCHEQKKPTDEVGKNGSDKQKDKNAENPSHKAQEKHGIRNDHEQEKSNEFNQNYHCGITKDNNDDEDNDEIDDEDEVEDDDQGGDDEEESEDQNEITDENLSGEDEDDDQVEYEDENKDGDEDEDEDQYEIEDEGEGGDDDESSDDDEDESSDKYEDENGYITVDLLAVRKEFQCPICLGIIRKTRTVMQCLHRFCKKCIDKSIRTGNKECPVCRAHCGSRRSLKDDPNYDTLISLLYPDIDKEEEEEMTLQENEMNHNNQIQASIAKTRQRQVKAMVRKRRTENSKNNVELQVSNDNDNYARIMGSSSSVDMTETEQKEAEEHETQFLLNYSSINAYTNRETLPWGINARSNRLSRIINHLRDSNANNDELEIHFMLVSLDEQKIPSLQEPHICCKPTVSVKILSKYVALKTGLQANQVELYLVEEPQANIIRGEKTVDLELEEDKLRVLRDEETLAELYTYNVVSCGHMLLAYKMK